MIETKGLASDVADRIGSFVSKKGNASTILQELLSDTLISSNCSAKEGISELKLLFEYIKMMLMVNSEDNIYNTTIIIDLSLARGLDYYTGMITEAVLEGNSFNFVGMF